MGNNLVSSQKLGEEVGRVLLTRPFVKFGGLGSDNILAPKICHSQVSDPPQTLSAADSDSCSRVRQHM